MLLISLTLTNFRCYHHIEFDDFAHLVVFIGENDAGKTVLLDAIELLVGNKNITLKDFRCLFNGESTNETVIKGVFRVEAHDTLADDFRTGANHDEVRLCREFKSAPNGGITSTVMVFGRGYEDERFDEFKGADNQKKLLNEYGIEAASNEPKRIEQMIELNLNGKLPRVEKERSLTPAQFTALTPHLPRIEMVSSSEYRTPEAIIQRTLQKVVASIVMPLNINTGQPEELTALQEVRQCLTEKLNEEIARTLPILQEKHKSLKRVSVYPNIDFSRSVTTNNMLLDCGEGEQGIDSVLNP